MPDSPRVPAVAAAPLAPDVRPGHVDPVLVIAAHGTRSPDGIATTEAIAAAVAAARPRLDVRIAYLDVARPSLTDVLDALAGAPAVVVPLLLSSGYHVLTDIPAVVRDRPSVRVSAHLGPDPLVIDALIDRLASAGAARAGGTAGPGGPAGPAGPGVAAGPTVAAGPGGQGSAGGIALVAVPSSRPEARAELDTAAALLAARLGRPVTSLTLGSDTAQHLSQLAAPVTVASYLLAGGEFLDALWTKAPEAATVSAPLGAHPAIIQLVLARYDAVRELPR